MDDSYQRPPALTECFATAAILVAAHWIISGYRYLTNNIIEALPIVWRVLDPTIMPGDYYLNMIQDHYNARNVYARLLAWLAGSQERLEPTLLILFLVFDLIFFAGLYRIARRLFATPRACLAAGVGFVVLEIVFVHSYAPGNVHVLFSEMQANLIAAAFLVWGFAVALEGRPVLPFVLVLIAALFHNLEGVLGYGVLVLWMTLRIQSGQRTDWPWVAAAAVVALLALVALIASQLPLASTFQADQDFIEMARRRAAHHHMPEVWPASQWIFLAGVALLGTFCLRHVDAPAPDRRLLTLFGIVLTGGFLLYCAGLLLVENATLYKLQAAKAMVFAYMVWGLAIAGVGWRVIRQWLVGDRGQDAVRRGAIAIVVVAVSGIALFILRYGGVSAAEMAVGRHLAAYQRLNYRTTDSYLAEEERALFQWLRENTPPDALILHPPELRYLRVVTQRSSVFTYHLIGLAPAMITEWLTRREATENYCYLTANEFVSLVRRYGGSHIVVHRRCTKPVGRMVYENGNFIVFVPDTPASHHPGDRDQSDRARNLQSPLPRYELAPT